MEEKREERFERLAAQYYEGKSVEEIIETEYGVEAAERSEKVREQVKAFWKTEKKLEETYRDMDVKMAVFDAIDANCGDDIAKKFKMTSDMKYLVSVHHLAEGKEELEEEKVDIEFLKETLKKGYEEEQGMAKDATEEELSALQHELESVLEKYDYEVVELLEQETEIEIKTETETEIGIATDTETETEVEAKMEAETEAEAAQKQNLKNLLSEVKNRITDKGKEDLSVLAAAVLLEENPDMPEEEAAVHASYLTGMFTGTSKHLLQLSGCMAAFAVLGSMGESIRTLGFIVESLFLVNAGTGLMAVGLTCAALVALAICGYLVYQGIKQSIPYMKKLWEKFRPYAKAAAEKVKKAVAFVLGVIRDSVVRPAIYWTSNTAVPFVKEKIYYPLKRRLERMWQWILDKVDSLKAFIRQAATEKSQNPQRSQRPQRPQRHQTWFEDEYEFEEEFEDEYEEDTEEESQDENPRCEWVLTD